MLLRCLVSCSFLLGLLPHTSRASNACIDQVRQPGLLTPSLLSEASDALGGNSIFLLGGRYSAAEISAANHQLVGVLKDKFISTQYVHGGFNPRPKMPITVELPQQKLANAKSKGEIRTIINSTIRESIFAALKSYDRKSGQPELIISGKESKQGTEEHVPRDLYDLLHSSSFELWSPLNVVSQFTFVFTNVQKVITTLSTPDRENRISPNLHSVIATLYSFMDPSMIPEANLPRFRNRDYNNLISYEARHYTVAMVLSQHQLALLGYNVKDLANNNVFLMFLDMAERQGTRVYNPITVR